MIYLDNAATTYPKPPRVRQAVGEALTALGANPGRGGYPMAVAATQAVYRCREEAAAFFGLADPACVSFQPSCTQALNQVLWGLLNPGDHLLISDLEHNAVLRPANALAARGVSVTVVPTVPGDSDATLDAFRKALRPNTRLAVCTQASNVWGFRLPVERLAALLHQYNVPLCVDAAQSAGLVPIDLAASGIDFLCVPGHKGLYGPMGVGLLLCRQPEPLLRPLIQGGTGTRSRRGEQPAELPERYEAGTLNLPGILGLQAGMAFVRSQGPETLWRRETELTARLWDRLRALPRVRLFTPRPAWPEALPVLSFTVEGLSCEEAAHRLGRKGLALRAGLHCAPLAHEKLGTLETGTLRASLSAFTRREEVDAAARLIGSLGGK